MAALSERKIEIVRTLVEAAPDKVVGGLQQALADTCGDTALASVKRLVEAEVFDRNFRNTVLLPVVPMCVGDTGGRHILTFPSRALALIWRGLKADFPEEVAAARAEFLEDRPGHQSLEPYDTLTAVAAAELRSREREAFRQAAELCDATRPGGADAFAACLELSGVVRRAAGRLPTWLARNGEDTNASVRLAYRDAVSVSEDAGPAFFEMLAAHMAHPWMVLRVISAVMDNPTERYLADSEMAGFGERVMDDVDAALKSIARMDLDGGPAVARATGKLVELITLQLTELETNVDLKRDHGWGARIAKQRSALASVVEGRLREAEKLTKEALPTQAARLKRIRRSMPRLDSPPLERSVGRATTLLTFVEEVRYSANYGGFSAMRARVLENLAEYIDHYVEEVLDLLKTGEAESEDNARAFLRIAADFSQLVQGDKAADLVRRRATAAHHPDYSTPAGA